MLNCHEFKVGVPRNENGKELPKTGMVFQAANKRALGVTPGLLACTRFG
jgi:hypothetical protein